MIPISKVCGHCKIEKLAEFFPLRKKNGGKYVWLRLQCNECVNKISRERYPIRAEVLKQSAKNYYLKNKEAQSKAKKIWLEVNKEQIKEKRKIKYKENSEEIKYKRKEYYKNNRDKQINSVKEYAKNNREKINKRLRVSHTKKHKKDINYTLKKLLRGRILAALKSKGVKCARTMELTGCTMEFLIKHLESLFTEGMEWNNHGLKGWHIDHKKPCSSFDLTDIEQQKVCFHWTNIQPLWWRDNLIKHNKIDKIYGNL